MDWMRHFIEVKAHEHGSKTKTMVAVEMADEDARDNRRRYVCEDKLTLRPLARVEKKALVIPANEIGAMVAKTRWLLARAAQDYNITYAHRVVLQAKKEHRPRRAPKKPPPTCAALAIFRTKGRFVKSCTKKEAA